MNVLIVDDEPIIRVGLRTLVDWEQYGFRLAGEASDGEEALERMRSEPPVDIVITDIRMPRMDGLALLRELKESDADVGLLVLSCLDDFAYVKEAMKLGAQDYVLKPTMEPEELIRILESIRTRLHEERRAKREIAEWQEQLKQSKAYRIAEWLRQYVASGAGEERLEAELIPPGSGVFTVWLEADPALMPAVDEWLIPDSRAKIKWSDRTWIVLFGYEKTVSERERHELMYSCAQRLYSRMKQELGWEEWCVCLGPPMTKLNEFSGSLAAHQRQLNGRFYGDADRLITDVPSPVEEAPLPYEERNDFLRAVSNGNREAALYWVEALTASIRRSKPSCAKVHAFVFEALSLAYGYARQQGIVHDDGEWQSDISIHRIQALPNVDALSRFMLDSVRQLWTKEIDGGSGKMPANPFIRKAVQFMREHYRRNIGSVDIADHVKLSRSYLSDLFSKEMGESLIETLTRIRIEEAKRKLRSGEMKVYEIAEAVGFSDSKSFAKTFKRLVGCTPKEFEAENK